MQEVVLTSDTSKISVPAARLAIGAAVAVILLLASLHALSPEFDPSWRVISEYALGQYGWVLSLMFVAGALNAWALAYTIWSQPKTKAGKIGLGFLIAAGVGPAMASVFDIPHPLHNLAGLIGVLSLPVAAMLISVSLGRTQPWSASKKVLLWTANLTWISIVLFVATMVMLIATYTRAGGDMTAGAIKTLPPGVIAVNGWANRFLLVTSSAWMITVAWQALKMKSQQSS